MELLVQLTSALFGTGLSQHARLITLASAQEGHLPEALTPERFAGREAVNELYAFDVDALSPSTDLDLDQFIGEELTVTLLQPDGSRRAWHGLCTQAAWLGADQKLVVQAGSSSITLKGGDITFACPGNFTVKGAEHVFYGGASKAAVLPGQPTKLSTFPPIDKEVTGPHEITMLGFSAEGESLTDAKVKYYDAAAGVLLAERVIDRDGKSGPLVAEEGKRYRALIGYRGWSLHFEEIKHEDDDDEFFDPCELEEDRPDEFKGNTER